ncbi:DUF7344 domain-containing protein [Natronorubrum thiooxidans]
MSTNNQPQREGRTVQPLSSFQALADSRCQFVLSYLSQRSNTVSVDELVERIPRPNEETPATIRLSLYHAQLPKLADAELIQYDAKQETVERTAMTGQVVAILDRARSIKP